MAGLLSLLGLQPDQAPMQASSMGATSMAQGQTMQQPKGLLGLGGNLGGFLDFQDPQKLIALQLINNGQKAPGQMFDGVPELAAYGAKVGQQKLEREQAQQAKNATTEFLKTNDPGLANLVAQGALTPAQAYSQYAQKQQQAQEEQRWQARQEYLANTPDAQLDRQYKQAQLGALTTKQTLEPSEIRTLKERARLAGLQEGTPEFQRFMLSEGKGPLVTVNTGEGGDFYKELDKNNAKMFTDIGQAGVQARSRAGMIDQLDGLMQNFETGGLASAKQYAGEWGINTEKLSDIQAAQALINKMVPEQRMPGSGTMSDQDLALFKASLPRIINQPGGNALIMQSLRGINQYQVDMGNIADAVADRSITPEEGRRRIRELQNPLSDFKKVVSPESSKGGNTARPQTQADFDALPSGAVYIDPDDGRTYRKP